MLCISARRAELLLVSIRAATPSFLPLPGEQTTLLAELVLEPMLDLTRVKICLFKGFKLCASIIFFRLPENRIPTNVCKCRQDFTTCIIIQLLSRAFIMNSKGASKAPRKPQELSQSGSKTPQLKVPCALKSLS